MTPVVVAVDGGGSKTDAVALGLDGTVRAHRRGPRSSPQAIGLAASVHLVDTLVREVAGGAPVARAELYLAGLDLPEELDAYATAIAGLDWATSTVADNDLFALLRAGTDEPDAVAVVCGTGMNAVGVRADGASVRFPALGHISGDWGGGSGLGADVLWHAARDVDGRGPHTALTGALEAEFGPVPDLIADLHFGRRDTVDLARLAPAVFALAASDPVAANLVDRQAAEVVAFASACLHRLGLTGEAVPVVLGGGVIQAGDQRLLQGIAAGITEVAPRARLVRVAQPPVLGAALLCLDHAGAHPEALDRARAELAAPRPAG